MSFKNLSLSKESGYYLKEKEFLKATGIQKMVIPKMIEGDNILALAPTGTGKSLAFSLPIMQRLKETEEDVESLKGSPRAIILSPIKELSMQLFTDFKEISHHHKLRVRKLLGGATSKETTTLARQEFEILIAGPDRLMSAIKRGEIKLDRLEFLVLDEADQLLDFGFSKIIESLVKKCTEAQIGLFSATIPAQLDDFVAKIFGERKFQKCVADESHKIARQLETYNISVQPKDKMKMGKVFAEKTAKGQGFIFCNLKKNATELFEFLKTEGITKIGLYHGDLSSKERTKVFKSFKEKKLQILVCSDIAARGLHIENLSWILNFDLPHTPLYYLHRAGRTGRMNKSGRVYNFVTDTKRDQLNIRNINKAIKNQLSFHIDEINFLDSAIKTKEIAKRTIKKKKVYKKQIKKKTKAKTVKKTPRYKRRK